MDQIVWVELSLGLKAGGLNFRAPCTSRCNGYRKFHHPLPLRRGGKNFGHCIGGKNLKEERRKRGKVCERKGRKKKEKGNV
jgi:hypothetical protein